MPKCKDSNSVSKYARKLLAYNTCKPQESNLEFSPTGCQNKIVISLQKDEKRILVCTEKKIEPWMKNMALPLSVPEDQTISSLIRFIKDH